MNWEENDPDTLQLLDELNSDWVKRWCEVTNRKKIPKKKEITFEVILTPKKKELWKQLALQFAKTKNAKRSKNIF